MVGRGLKEMGKEVKESKGGVKDLRRSRDEL